MKVEFIAGAKNWYRMYSIWFFAMLGITPDLFNLAVQNGIFSTEGAPALLARIVNVVAFAGAASRLIKQKQLEIAPEKSEESQDPK